MNHSTFTERTSESDSENLPSLIQTIANCNSRITWIVITPSSNNNTDCVMVSIDNVLFGGVILLEYLVESPACDMGRL